MPTFVRRQHVPSQDETCRWQSTKAVPVCLTKLSPNPFSVPLAGAAGAAGAAVLSVEARSIPKSATVASCALAWDRDRDRDRDTDRA